LIAIRSIFDGHNVVTGVCSGRIARDVRVVGCTVIRLNELLTDETE
jgi:hypothetical protein